MVNYVTLGFSSAVAFCCLVVTSKSLKMVTTIQQNATAEANPSVTKFTKEKNDFKMKQCQQYAAKESLDQYQLNLYVIDLNSNSIIT